MGVGPSVVVDTAAFHARVRGSFPSVGGLKETQIFLLHTLENSVLWGASSGGVLGLRPPGFEFRILYLEGCVISFISPSSGGSPGPI